MIILGIETSCDDTCCALLEIKRGKFRLIKSIVASQANLHKKYGGVVPEVAARAHVEAMIPVIKEVTGQHRSKIDAIAVASGPGLITSLHVGVETAKALSYAWNVPLVKVNHVEGHIYSPLISRRGLADLKFPAIALVVSGGHTELILMRGPGQYSLLGRTRDDAAGECFDKSAKMLGFPYPSGPQIGKRAKHGNPEAYDIPRPMIDRDDFEFSFSGMKNAIRLLVENMSPPLPNGASLISPLVLRGGLRGGYADSRIPDICASIEQAIIDVLVHKSLKATDKYHPKTFILSGGVSANKKLRKTLKHALPKKTKFLVPDLSYCMDNAAMISVAAYHQAKNKKFTPYYKLTANANWELV